MKWSKSKEAGSSRKTYLYEMQLLNENVHFQMYAIVLELPGGFQADFTNRGVLTSGLPFARLYRGARDDCEK